MNTWNNLSLSEKSEMMRVAIENGITTLPEIREAYNEFAKGGNLFSGEEDHSSQMHQGYVYDVLPKMLKEAGLDVRVTSGYRRSGQAGTAGSRSWHTHHGAVDIVPQGKTTFEDIENALYNNPVISRYMMDNGFGLIDESGRTAESRATMKKTGATGAHFHIGKDSKAVSAYNNRMSSIWDNNMNQLEAAINQPAPPVFMPSNPQAFFTPIESYQRPIVVEEPLVQAAMENPYSPEQLEREERAQGLRNLGLAMGIMRGGQEQLYSPLWSAVNMLSGNQMAKGGKIHIKPENRGKFTALKKRTGHSATWFKQHGTPAQKKMATFELNAKKWKHGLGGNLFSGEDEPTQQMNNGLNLYRRTNNLGETEYIYQETPDSEEILLTPTNKRFSDDPTNWDYKDASGREYSPRMASPTSSSTLEASEKMGPLEKYVAELNWRTKNDPASIALQGKYTMPAIAAAPFLTWAGEATYPYLSAALANPYVDAGLTSAFAGHGLNHAINEGIDGWGDAAITALEIAPLGRLAKPLYESTSNIINSAYNKLPWTYKIPENPNMAYRRMGPLERDWLMEGNELSTRETNALTEAEEEAAKLDPKYTTQSGLRFNFFKPGAEHGGRKQFAKGQPWKGTTVTHGEEQVLAIPGKDLPWVSGRHFHGPQGNGFRVGDISFEEAPFGSHIDLLTNEGYSGVNPSLLDGSVIYSPYKILGRNFGYKKLYPKITAPQITAENAASAAPEQWTAAQDAAIAKGDMVEAQRLRDLHSSLTDSAIPGKYYRGTQTKRNSYPDRHIDEEVGEMNGIYLTKKPKYAKTYGDVEEFYLRSNNPLETEGSWTGVIDDATRAEIENAGYDAVVNNRFDTGFLNKLLRNSRDETITFNGKNLKLADAVTYDDAGTRIPLGERDNFNINDIRYGLLPFGIGLGTFGALYGGQE